MKTNALTLGGILVALSILLLYLTTLLPTNTFVLLTLVSFVPPIAFMEKGLKTALLVYICTGLSSLLLIPINITLLYLLFFGLYGIIKGLIERFNKPFVEIVLKLLFFNSLFLIGVFLLSRFLGIDLQNTFITHLASIWAFHLNAHTSFLILWGLAQPIFLIYDYALTLLVGHYDDFVKRLRK